MSPTLLRLRPLVLALGAVVLLPATASAAGDSRPSPPPGGHDATKPAVMAQVSAEVASARVGPLAPRTAVTPLRPRTRMAANGAAAAGPPQNREVFGFAKADSLGDPGVGFTTWNFSQLTDVAYFGIHVNADGTLVQTDSGWAVWHSGTASSFINTAHNAGVRVLLSLMMFDQAGMCQALSAPQTTISQVRANLMGADGVDIDYEGTSATCPDGVTLRSKVVSFAQAVRAANLGYLVIDTYASAAEDSGGFFDIPNLASSVDAFFVMAYGLEGPNGPCSTCMGPTSPFDGTSPAYVWNDTRTANDYLPWAGKSIMGYPYYGVAGCVQPNPPPNAPVASPAHYAGVPYTVFPTLPTNPVISSFQESRDALDPNGQEPWASYNDSDPSLNCWREAYWDDAVSLGHKYDLVNQLGFRGAGIFTLDYGGGTPELWNALAQRFSQQSVFDGLGGVATASPTIASWGPNRLDVFVRGTDNGLWHKWWDGTGWSGWEPLGGVLTSGPAAVSWGPNRIDVFVRGTNNGLWHKWWDGSSWNGWEPLGGGLTAAPAIASWAAQRLDVFVRGTDNQLWHKWYDGTGWNGWEPLGGVLASGPGAVSWGPNRIDVFATGTDTTLEHRWWDGAAWRGWESLGGSLSAVAPAPTSAGPGLLDVFMMGSGGWLSHQTWSGVWSAVGSIRPSPPLTWQFGPAAVNRSGLQRADVITVSWPDGEVWHTAFS